MRTHVNHDVTRSGMHLIISAYSQKMEVSYPVIYFFVKESVYHAVDFALIVVKPYKAGLAYILEVHGTTMHSFSKL